MSLYKLTVQSLVLTANNIITLDDDEVYERVLPQISTLAESFSSLHSCLTQLDLYYTNCEFVFGQQTVENDILDYTRLLKKHETALDEVMEYYLSGGLQDSWSLDKAEYLKELLNAILENCNTVCEIL